MPTSAFQTEIPRCPFGSCDMLCDRKVIGKGWDFEYHTTKDESEMVKCTHCDIIHPSRLPVSDALPVIYPQNYYAFSETTHENPLVRAVRRWVARRKGRVYRQWVRNPAANVLDIGCGDGRLLDILKQSCPAGWRYSGVDWSEAAAERIRAKGYEARAGDIEQLDLDDWSERFDLILMHQVIEHVRYPRSVLAKLRSLLKPGGILAIETPDINAWDYWVFRKRYWAGYHIPRHFFIFNKTNFTALARELGYEVAAVRSVINPVAWIHSVKSWCADHRFFSRLAGFFNAQNPLLLSVATPIDLVQTRLAGKSSNMQLFLRRAETC